MNRLERAVILAAGSGTRLRPLTIHTPKPLLWVNGERPIDSVIRALLYNGIEEVYIVVGYLRDAFVPLTRTYPSIRLIDNPGYALTNNISSLYCARAHLENAVILDGDHLIRNPDIFRPAFARSGYLAVPNEGPTHEWTLDVRQDVIHSCTRGGGSDGYRLVSISLWSKQDGARLAEDVKEVYIRQRKTDLYWDDVPLFAFPSHYPLGIRKISAQDVVEIDTIAELAALDGTYAAYL